LKKAVEATIQRILEERPIQPHKVAYYLERRDSAFDEKMKEVLCIYQEASVQNKIARFLDSLLSNIPFREGLLLKGLKRVWIGEENREAFVV